MCVTVEVVTPTQPVAAALAIFEDDMEIKYTNSESGLPTVREMAAWLQSLPEEFQNAPIQSSVGPGQCPPKRVVAYRDKDDPKFVAVTVNPMGTHLPFTDELIWEHVLH